MSLAPTRTAPFLARKRAACLPTAPNPCTTTRAPLRSRPIKSGGHVDTSRNAKPGGADLVERDAADGAWKADRAAGLVLDPAHAEFVGAHIGPGHVVADVADRAGEGSNEVFFVGRRHARIADITDLPPPWRRPAAAFFQVIARASRKHSSTVTSGAMRTPPIATPHAVLSMTSIAFKSTNGRWM